MQRKGPSQVPARSRTFATSPPTLRKSLDDVDFALDDDHGVSDPEDHQGSRRPVTRTKTVLEGRRRRKPIASFEISDEWDDSAVRKAKARAFRSTSERDRVSQRIEKEDKQRRFDYLESDAETKASRASNRRIRQRTKKGSDKIILSGHSRLGKASRKRLLQEELDIASPDANEEQLFEFGSSQEAEDSANYEYRDDESKKLDSRKLLRAETSRHPRNLFDHDDSPAFEFEDEEEEGSFGSDAESDQSFDFALPSQGQKLIVPSQSVEFPAASRPPDASIAISGKASGKSTNVQEEEVARLAELTTVNSKSYPADNVTRTSYSAIRSGYMGTDFGSNISVTIKALQETATTQQVTAPLFRWIHITPPVGINGCMDFRAFINAVLQAPGLNQADRIDLKRTLLWACGRSEKPLRTLEGQRGHYMEPTFNEVRIKTNKRHKPQKKNIQLLCIPYFSLDRYTSQVLPQKSALHPVRTLLQTQYPSVSKERDMQQAVSLAAETPKDYCYHVPQLWSLILNDKLLVTYAPVDAPRLCGNKIDLDVVPAVTATERSLEVFESPNRLWLFPFSTCRNWFMFIAHFAEEVSLLDNVEDFYHVYHDGRKISSKDWPKIISLAETSRVRIKVKRHTTARNSGSDDPWRLDTATILSKGDEDESSSSSSSDTDEQDNNEYSAKGSNPASQKLENLSPITITHSWSRDLASFKDGKTYLPSRAINVERIKGLGYEPIVQEGMVIFARRLEFYEIDMILQLSVVFQQTTQDKKRHINSLTARDKEYFHLFLWIPRSGNPDWNVEDIYESLFATLQFLWNMSNGTERKAFRRCPLSSKKEVEQHVYKNHPGSSISSRSASSKSMRLFSAAKALLSFFIPIQMDATVVQKYWGAVYRIISDEKYTVTFVMLGEFESMAQSIKGLQRLLSGGKAPPDLKLPDDFVKAWLHCLMFLILVEPMATDRAVHHLSKSYDLILKGKLQILREAAESSLRVRQAALPQSILLAAISGLLQDMTYGRPDVITTYWDCLKQLELDIKANPLKRYHQRKITSLKQEVGAVMKTLEGQSEVIEDLTKAIIGRAFRSKRSQHRDRMKDPDMMLLRSCTNSIHAKIAGFDEIMDHANTLRIENLRMIESNKDRQEAAIYAFTIVTVIFLPLSFVSSLLGMNTSDIRDMQYGQWIYWAGALPLTGLIIILCLLFTGDIIDFTKWMRRLVPHRSQDYGHNILASESAAADRSPYSPAVSNPHGESWIKRYSASNANVLRRRVADRINALGKKKKDPEHGLRNGA